MIQSITAGQLLSAGDQIPLVDVRTPAEFNHGHIPGAFNIPLFSNEERVTVGTTYKQVGKEAAILLGFDLTGPKWSGFIREALKVAPGMNVAVHCWRGGMRSGAMAWALNLYGFNVHLVSGGYKAYRRWCRQQFEKKFRMMIIGGMTGSGKTRLLGDLKSEGEQTVDLEEIACHQGSVYGSMNKLIQPTQEQFENNLGLSLSELDPKRRLWLEDESINIGCCQIPNAFWKQMQGGTVLELQVPAEDRVKNLVLEYGCLDKEFLIEKTERIRKRLGPEQTRDAIGAIKEDRMEDFIRIVLVYYDKTYRAGLRKRDIQQLLSVPDTKVTTLLQTAGELENSYHPA